MSQHRKGFFGQVILIKCLKGDKSLGSLSSVVKTLIVSGVRPTNGQAHLLSCSGQLRTARSTKWTKAINPQRHHRPPPLYLPRKSLKTETSFNQIGIMASRVQQNVHMKAVY